MTPVLSFRVYVTVYVALLILTVMTTAVAYIDLGALNTVAAVGIAVIKAVIVAWFFMHIAYSRHRTQIVAVLWLLILITFTLSDVLTRGLVASTPRW